MLYCTKCKKFFADCEGIEIKKKGTYPNNVYKVRNCLIYGCDGDVVEIDEDMVPIVNMLQSKGYSTKFCCSGHPDGLYGGYWGTYVVIDMDYESFAELNPYIFDYEWDYIEIIDSKDESDDIGVIVHIKKDILESIPNEPITTYGDILKAFERGMKARIEIAVLATMLN